MTGNLTFIGLNEFNSDLIQEMANILPRDNYISRLLALRKVECRTEDQLESGYLEPWVQWVGIQTSTPSTVHGIKNLGDISRLDQPQLWERLSKHGKSSIVWGAMNARRGNSDECQIFIPDPWVFDEPASPEAVRAFVEFPRYLAKNYTSLSKTRVIAMAGSFLMKGLRHAGLRNFAGFLWLGARGLAKFGFRHIAFICAFEYLSAAVFCRQAQKLKPDLSYVFLNSLAHAQHHYWKTMDAKQLPEIIYAYGAIEKILAMIDRELGLFSGGAPIVVTNALSQTNTTTDPTWVLYRVRNMDDFLIKLGISFNRVETMMTYDGHVLFDSQEAMTAAHDVLAEIRIDGKPLFFLESDPEQLKIFFRIEFTDSIDPNAEISTGSRRFKFDDEIKTIVVRTGKHIQNSVVYHNCMELDAHDKGVILNHEIFRYIYPDLFVDEPAGQFEAG